MNDITGNIKAFMRPECVDKCISSAYNSGIRKINVGYDGPKHLEDEHKQIIEKWRDIGDLEINFYTFEFNYGLSAVRNKLQEVTDTKYFFQLDDDNYIPKNALVIKKFLEKYNNYGAVSIGWITPYLMLEIDAYDLKIENDYLVRWYKSSNKFLEMIDGIVFMAPFDFIPNCAMWRTSVFDEIKWDEKFKINREHEDFMLRLKLETKWKLATALNLFAIHDQKRSKSMTKYRVGKEYRKSVRYFLKKWNLNGIYPSSYNVRLLTFERNLRYLKELDYEDLFEKKRENIYYQ